MTKLWVGMLAIAATILIYMLSVKVYQTFPKPYTLPIILASSAIILLLSLFDIPYDIYMIGGKWIDRLLGPAIVAFAYPLYKQFDVLKQHALPILTSVTVGSVVGILTGWAFAKGVGLSHDVVDSVVPKSITTPIALEVTKLLGGIPSLAAVLVIFAGICGVVFGQGVYRFCRVGHYLGRGIGWGVASHAIGTSYAYEQGEKEGAVSSVAMILSAIMAPLIVHAFRLIGLL